jgi:TRAP-type C4-dicarboxylate transport system permease small subunit
MLLSEKIMIKLLKLIDDILDKSCYYLLIACVFIMLFISVLTIVLRWFGVTYLWFDPLARHLVFFCAFLGGSLAVRKDNHIRIDLTAKILETKGLFKLERAFYYLTNAVCTFGSIWLAKASYDFLLSEIEYGKVVFLGIHSSVLVGSIPVGFAIISYRFFFRVINKAFIEEVKV